MAKKVSVSDSVETEIRGVSSESFGSSFPVWLEIADVMSRDVISISPDDTVVYAARVMSESKISCIVVLDGDDLAGIVTERDFLEKVGGGEKDFAKRKVAEIMSSPVASVPPSLAVFEASKLMGEKGIKRLVVVEEGSVVGIVTQTDLIRASASYGMWRDVTEIISGDVATVEKGASVAEAAEVMTRRKISCIVVMEADEVAGVLTERDVLKRVIGMEKDPAAVKTKEAMSSPAMSVAPDSSILSASWIMERMDIRRLVVIDDNQLRGIITQTDIFRVVKQKLQSDIGELSQLRERLKTEKSFAGIVGRDKKMLEVYETIREVAEVDIPVLIQGESGTGKELVAAAIHNGGGRSGKPFVPVNCGALPEGVLESELFGHVKGAFTGAVSDRKGRFELADGGTIFLDEIGDFPPEMQVKLLRVLQEGGLERVGGGDTVKSFRVAPGRLSFQRVGGEGVTKVDVRVISATNKNLAEEVAAGRFRQDLYYRLCVVPVYLPPLRERLHDIGLLAEHLLRKALVEAGREGIVLSSEAVNAMMDYDWPGNVRELENAIRYGLVKCKGNLLLPEHLPGQIFGGRVPAQSWPRRAGKEKKQRRRKLDADSVRQALEEAGGNKVEAARLLGVSRATLYRFLQESEKAKEAAVV
ncbi:MAG: sigma 54-interacting transcriptional regulator [Planctomycetota bacterium]|jgi:transcriptional regulator with GAF, ATPase, and Fis domain